MVTLSALGRGLAGRRGLPPPRGLCRFIRIGKCRVDTMLQFIEQRENPVVLGLLLGPKLHHRRGLRQDASRLSKLRIEARTQVLS